MTNDGMISITLVYSILIVFVFLCLSIVTIYIRKINYEDTIINDSKIEMSSTYVKDLRNGFPVSQGINSCFDLRIKNSEIYLDLYQGFNINTTDTTELLDLYINDFNYNSILYFSN